MKITDQNSLVQAIHETPVKCVLSTTGGGTEIFPILLARGGGSATFIGGNIPYSGSITKKTMGGTPDKLVDEPVARILAMSAYQMALEHRDSKADPIFGVGGTSILQRTPDERPGDAGHPAGPPRARGEFSCGPVYDPCDGRECQCSGDAQPHRRSVWSGCPCRTSARVG
jgi:hypothetical protein